MFKIIPNGEPLSYILSTETRLSTDHHKYRTKITETLSVLDVDFTGVMSVTPLSRKILII